MILKGPVRSVQRPHAMLALYLISMVHTALYILQEGALCALDLLSVAGLINYFGKVNLAADQEAGNQDVDGMQIKPVMLQKGKTRLAMYGVGNMKDARMHYELRSNRVRMYMPEEDEEQPWFNLLLVHQNR